MANIKYFLVPTGYLRLIVSAIGLIVLILGWHSHVHWNKRYGTIKFIVDEDKSENMDKRRIIFSQDDNLPNITLEKFFVGIVTLTFLTSLLLAVGHAITIILSREKYFIFLDVSYHGIMGILIFISSCLMLYSTVGIQKVANKLTLKDPIQLHAEKIATGSLGLINALLYVSISVLLLLSSMKMKSLRK